MWQPRSSAQANSPYYPSTGNIASASPSSKRNVPCRMGANVVRTASTKAAALPHRDADKKRGTGTLRCCVLCFDTVPHRSFLLLPWPALCRCRLATRERRRSWLSLKTSGPHFTRCQETPPRFTLILYSNTSGKRASHLE